MYILFSTHNMNSISYYGLFSTPLEKCATVRNVFIKWQLKEQLKIIIITIIIIIMLTLNLDHPDRLRFRDCILVSQAVTPCG